MGVIEADEATSTGSLAATDEQTGVLVGRVVDRRDLEKAVKSL